MTEGECQIAAALNRCSFLPGSWDKRFARDMAFLVEHAPDRPLSVAQSAQLIRLAHKYRRQMPAALVQAARTLSTPDAADQHRTG